MNIERTELEKIVREILSQKLGTNGIRSVAVPSIPVSESDRLDTGNPADRVYTHDLFTLSESPRLGCGIMEMTDSAFDWHLSYDEIDYIISGSLSIISNGTETTAKEGEIILIPKNSDIRFSVRGFARFLYFTYPANWSEV